MERMFRFVCTRPKTIDLLPLWFLKLSLETTIWYKIAKQNGTEDENARRPKPRHLLLLGMIGVRISEKGSSVHLL